MRPATFIMEGSRQQTELVSAVLSSLLNFVNWKHVVNYEVSDQQKTKIFRLVVEVREAWWPVAKKLLLPYGQMGNDLFRLIDAKKKLSSAMESVLGGDNITKIFEPADLYYLTGSLPLEWILHNGFPLSLYAPIYRFARPQDVMTLNPPMLDGPKLFVAPLYSKPQLAGINSAVKESALWVSRDSAVTLLQGDVNEASLRRFGDRQFARLMFHGHATEQGLLASDGTPMPFASVLKIVQGPAFLLGCSTGSFETGTIQAIARQIPVGLHGALLSAFPTPTDFTKKMNEIIVGTFRFGDARRVQDIAHMTRLALAWMGIIYALRSLSGAPFISEKFTMVTPFEAQYDGKFESWGNGVARLQSELAKSPQDLKEAVFSTASSFASGVVSCGTPAFLLPGADPLAVQATKAFATWNGVV